MIMGDKERCWLLGSCSRWLWLIIWFGLNTYDDTLPFGEGFSPVFCSQSSSTIKVLQAWPFTNFPLNKKTLKDRLLWWTFCIQLGHGLFGNKQKLFKSCVYNLSLRHPEKKHLEDESTVAGPRADRYKWSFIWGPYKWPKKNMGFPGVISPL